MPELVDVFNEVLAEHRTKAGGCECGWARPRSEWQEPGFEEAHEAHQAEQLAARLEQVGEAQAVCGNPRYGVDQRVLFALIHQEGKER